MTEPLWTWTDLVAASGGRTDGDARSGVSGVSIDSRSLQPGDLFVALQDARDGHEFVPSAFKSGAAAALVREDYARKPGDAALLRVPDPLQALEALARAARARVLADARIIAVTGSAGKTTTKELLRAGLSAVGRTHASEKSYNNHWGVPLTLARMPAETLYGVFEIGMNHAGEIAPLSQLVRPNAAIITTVADAHLENFADGLAGIARAKAEIFAGADNGWAILPYDDPNYAILAEHAAARRTLRIVPFTANGAATDAARPPSARLLAARAVGERTEITVELPSGAVRTFELSLHGAHNVSNALAVAALIDALTGADVSIEMADRAFEALASVAPAAGRGARHFLGADKDILLIDESYNANPASMRAALAVLSQIPRAKYARRIAVLGDMLELGLDAPQLHRALTEAVVAAGVDVVFACGPHMKGLYDALPPAMRGRYVTEAGELGAELESVLRSGDVIMIKASNGTRLGPVAEALKQKFSAAIAGG